MAFVRFTSAVESKSCLPPPYHLECHTFAWVGGTRGQSERLWCKPFISRAGTPEHLLRQLLGLFFFILHVSWFAPVLSCAQPAYHYKTSGPYCITDGADRRERRQPACFLERRRVCSWVRVEGGIVRNNGTENFICLHQGRKKKNQNKVQNDLDANSGRLLKCYKNCLDLQYS